MIESALARVAQRLAWELAQESLAAGHLLLALGTFDHGTRTAELALRQPLSGAQMLAKAAGSLLNQVRLRAGVVEATLTAGRLQALQPPQLDLFSHGGDQAQRLSATLATLMSRYQGSQVLAGHRRAADRAYRNAALAYANTTCHDLAVARWRVCSGHPILRRDPAGLCLA